MKTVILVKTLWSAGTQKFAILQTKALAEAGRDVEIISLRKAKYGSAYDDLFKGMTFFNPKRWWYYCQIQRFL